MQELPKKVRCKLDARQPPGQVAKEELFTFEGTLTEKDTSAPIEGALVDLYIDGVLVASTTTALEGRWSFDVSIPTEGTHSIYAEFPGDATHFGCPDIPGGWLVPAGLVVAGLVAWLAYRGRST